MSKRIIEGSCTVYLSTDGYKTVDQIMEMEPDTAVHQFIFYKPDANIDTWIKVGTAKITVELDATDDYVTSVVDSLKAQQRQIQGEAEARCNALQSRINSLLCLEYIPASES